MDSANIAEYSASHPKIYSGVYGGTQDDDLYFKDDSIPEGDDDFAGTKELLVEMLKDAIDQGLRKHLHTQVPNRINKYSDIFRSKIGSGAPADIPAMKISLNSAAKQVTEKLRRHSPPQAAF